MGLARHIAKTAAEVVGKAARTLADMVGREVVGEVADMMVGTGVGMAAERVEHAAVLESANTQDDTSSSELGLLRD